jgi:hypothetical protein
MRRVAPVVSLCAMASVLAGCGGSSSAPAIAILTPGTGPVGTLVTLDGHGLGATTIVGFGGVPARFRQISPDEVVAIVPPGARTGTVSLTSKGGSTHTSAVFTVAGEPLPTAGRLPVAGAPSILSFYPVAGLPGIIVDVRGGGFEKVAGVTVGGASATFRRVDDSDLRFVVPPTSRSGPIVVHSAGGAATSSTPFTVQH